MSTISKKVQYTGSFFEYNSLKLPIRKTDPATKHLIPKRRKYIYENPEIEEIMDSVNQSENVLIIGEPGCGKSEFVLHLAAETNTPIVQIQGDGEMSVVDLIGGFQYDERQHGTVWIDGVVPFALKHRCWILEDEINMILPEVLSRQHSMMDDRRHLDLKEIGDIVPVPEETVLFGTMNPHDDGRHVGTKPLSPALLSRFHILSKFDFLSAKTEIQLLVERTGVDQNTAKRMVRIATKAREGFRNQEMTELVDTRMLLSWAKKSRTFGIERAIKTTVLNRLDEPSFDVIKGVLMADGIVKPGTTK